MSIFYSHNFLISNSIEILGYVALNDKTIFSGFERTAYIFHPLYRVCTQN